MGPARAIAVRTLVDSRTRTVSFALLFLFIASASVLGYEGAYPTRADRLDFARSVEDNAAVRLLYGIPHDLLTVGGYAGWRLVGGAAVFAALWGALAAVRAVRAEEDAGRQELVLAGTVGRSAALGAALLGIGAGAVVLWLALFAGILTSGTDPGASAYLALAVVSPLPVFVGVGALASQLAPTRRAALALATSVLGASLLLRMVADTVSGLGWLRWTTPLGWAEELRAFAEPRPAVLLLPAAATAVLLLVSAHISTTRDVGSGLLAARDSAEPRLRLLSSPTALAVRLQRGSYLAWLAGIAAYALILGVVSDSVSSALSDTIREQLEKLGAPDPGTPGGFLGFAFTFFVLAISLFVVFQLGAAREEESEQRLETLLTQPVSRARWLGGRLVVAAAGASLLALSAGLVAWVGAVSAGADVSLRGLLEAGANCLPVSMLFLGLGALAVALLPRQGIAVAYGVVAASYVWEAVGGLLEVPGRLRDVSPFHHVALVPAASFAAAPAGVMLALGAAAAIAAAAAFRRRDLAGT